MLRESNEDGSKGDVLKLTRAQFKDLLAENKVICSERDLDLILSYLDPCKTVKSALDRYDPSPLIRIEDHVEKVVKNRIGQCLVMNCIYEQI